MQLIDWFGVYSIGVIISIVVLMVIAFMDNPTGAEVIVAPLLSFFWPIILIYVIGRGIHKKFEKGKENEHATK